jgi:hypothetical protein
MQIEPIIELFISWGVEQTLEETIGRRATTAASDDRAQQQNKGSRRQHDRGICVVTHELCQRD